MSLQHALLQSAPGEMASEYLLCILLRLASAQGTCKRAVSPMKVQATAAEGAAEGAQV